MWNIESFKAWRTDLCQWCIEYILRIRVKINSKELVQEIKALDRYAPIVEIQSAELRTRQLDKSATLNNNTFVARIPKYVCLLWNLETMTVPQTLSIEKILGTFEMATPWKAVHEPLDYRGRQ